jgi:hypothetical protein
VNRQILREAEGWPGIGGWHSSFDPAHTAQDSPALWRAEAASCVVTLDRAPDSPFGTAPILPDQWTAERLEEGGRHLVIDMSGVRHRLWLRSLGPDMVILLPIAADPVRVAAADAARRFLAGRPVSHVDALHPTAFQRARLALLLDVLDADLEGASNRMIGTGLVYPWLSGVSLNAWKASSERRRTQRLIVEARAMMETGYRRLLRGN